MPNLSRRRRASPPSSEGRGIARILSHPFRLGPNGTAATVEQDSDAGDAEQIAALALTVRGERELVPAFGISDPALQGIIPEELAAGVGRFGPPVRIHSVTARPLDELTQVVEVRFD